MQADIVIAGGGLAGSCAAWFLSSRYSIVWLTGSRSGASEMPAGLVNPFTGRMAKPIWYFQEAWNTLHHLLHASETTSYFHQTGILRPVFHERQIEVFKQRAEHHPDHLQWVSPTEIQHRFPTAHAPHGALWQPKTGFLRIKDWLKVLKQRIQTRGAVIYPAHEVRGWEESTREVRVHTSVGSIHARWLILAVGASYIHFPLLQQLRLHQVKGQLVALQASTPSAPMPPAMAGTGYVLPYTAHTVIVGSTYEHAFQDLRPSATQTQAILQKVAQMWPEAPQWTPTNAWAGIRVTVPGTRLPMVGPLSADKRTWIFTGLGAKGILLAPFLARKLPAWLRGDEAPFKEVFPQ